MQKENSFKDSTSGDASYVNDSDDGGALVVTRAYKGKYEWILDFGFSFHMNPDRDFYYE